VAIRSVREIASVFAQNNPELLPASNPIAVTFSFNIDWSLFTQADMEGTDYAEALVEASFDFGGVTNDFHLLCRRFIGMYGFRVRRNGHA
jgi:hypothetical protein